MTDKISGTRCCDRFIMIRQDAIIVEMEEHYEDIVLYLE